MELIGTADERVFKKRTKLIVIKILLLLDCVHDAISAADVSCRDASGVMYLSLSLSQLHRLRRG
jgi:hypothetical protein